MSHLLLQYRLLSFVRINSLLSSTFPFKVPLQCVPFGLKCSFMIKQQPIEKRKWPKLLSVYLERAVVIHRDTRLDRQQAITSTAYNVNEQILCTHTHNLGGFFVLFLFQMNLRHPAAELCQKVDYSWRIDYHFTGFWK